MGENLQWDSLGEHYRWQPLEAAQRRLKPFCQTQKINSKNHNLPPAFGISFREHTLQFWVISFVSLVFGRKMEWADVTAEAFQACAWGLLGLEGPARVGRAPLPQGLGPRSLRRVNVERWSGSFLGGHG